MTLNWDRVTGFLLIESRKVNNFTEGIQLQWIIMCHYSDDEPLDLFPLCPAVQKVFVDDSLHIYFSYHLHLNWGHQKLSYLKRALPFLRPKTQRFRV